MGWDAEQAEDQYWEARANGLSDADILRGDPDEDDDLWHLGHRQEEEPTMKATEKKTASQLRALIEEASALLKKMENYPEEPEQDLVVIEVRFGPSLKTYAYAGIKISGKWYLTGSNALKGVEWYSVFEYFESRNAGIMSIEPAVRLSDVQDFI